MEAINPTVVTDLLHQSMAKGQMPALTIVSNSMAPLIWRGDKIRIEPVNSNDLLQSDIVVMQLPHTYMTHRFWGTTADGQLLTRGDRPLQFDKPWATTALVGRVVALEKQGKWVSVASIPANKHLARISCLETKLFAPTLPSHTTLPAPFKISTFFHKLPLLQRLLRRGLYSWAKLLVWINI